MDDLSNRETAQETEEQLSADQRDALKHCLDDFVALMNARFVDGVDSTTGHGAPKQPH